jgi:hypothetical protein
MARGARAAVGTKIFEEQVVEIEDAVRRERAQLAERITRRCDVVGVFRSRPAAGQCRHCHNRGRQNRNHQLREGSTRHDDVSFVH